MKLLNLKIGFLERVRKHFDALLVIYYFEVAFVDVAVDFTDPIVGVFFFGEDLLFKGFVLYKVVV